MGSLSGRSKAPSQPVQQVVYVPASVADTSTTATQDPQPDVEETLAQRAENVLRRSRSRLGTVLTGFQGILSQNDLVPPRKTLLGE